MWVKNDEIYKVLLTCGDCGHKLQETTELTGKELSDKWTSLVLGSGFVAGQCPKGCRATYSDLNINTDMKVQHVKSGEIWNRHEHEELFR